MTKAIEQLNAAEAIELLQRCDQFAAPCVLRLFNDETKAQLRRMVHRVHGERAA